MNSTKRVPRLWIVGDQSGRYNIAREGKVMQDSNVVDKRHTVFSVFEKEPLFLVLAFLLCGIVSILKGLHRPSDWAATQALIDYHFGFVKRGLFGATVAHWFHLEHYARFVVLSFLLLGVLFLSFGLLAFRSRFFSNTGSAALVILFVSSYSVTYLTDLVGYMDILLALLTILLVSIRKTRMRFYAALPLCLLAPLLHEMFFIVFLPTILFTFLMDGLLTERPKERNSAWIGGGSIALLAAAITLRTSLESSLSAVHVREIQQVLAARSDFPLYGEFFKVLSRSGKDNLILMQGVILHDHRWGFNFIVSLFVFGPTAILLWLGIRKLLASLLPVSRSGYASFVAAVAVASPVFMNFLGLDNSRWNALVCLNAALLFLVLLRFSPNVKWSPAFLRAVLLFTALNMATEYRLMNTLPGNAFPFTNSTIDAIQSIRHGGLVPVD
ncbi:hypothetical protein [Granulicella pectinivorans]|uniref:hypothetical protein n=1 Tax=Granulicella pectinivorans TaxID=474950 RepID=UPI00158705A3|nr:hypothetical protein [Granulicella pectinivorans]